MGSPALSISPLPSSPLPLVLLSGVLLPQHTFDHPPLSFVHDGPCRSCPDTDVVSFAYYRLKSFLLLSLAEIAPRRVLFLPTDCCYLPPSPP